MIKSQFLPFATAAVVHIHHWAALQERYWQSQCDKKDQLQTFLCLVLGTSACKSEFCIRHFFRSLFFQVLAWFSKFAPTVIAAVEKAKDKKIIIISRIGEVGAKTSFCSPGSRSLTGGWSSDPRYGKPDASAPGSLKLVCRKFSELQKSRFGYCCIAGKDSKRSVNI